MEWIESLNAELAQAAENGMLRRLRVCAGASLPEVTLDGRRVVQFASNNYLGLSTHPRVVGAAKAALDQYGSGSGASRLLGGTQAIHAELETELAACKGAEAALVYATGSMANLGLLSALAGDQDLVLLDKSVHATLYDGARLSRALVQRFPHQDLGRLKALLEGARQSKPAGRILVAVDAVYSMEGDLAPLPDLLALCERYAALLVVDEAHSTGVLGATGRGILEHYGLGWHPQLIITGTLSKALASLGGFVAGPRTLIDYLVNRSRSFIFATGLPASAVAAALEALRVIGQEPQHLQRLRRNREALAAGLEALGWDLGGSQSPILPLVLVGAPEAVALQERLWEAGFYAPAVRPPTVAANACRLRVSVSAAHQPRQIDRFLQALGSRP